MHTIFIKSTQTEFITAISALSSVTELSHLAVVDNRHSVVPPGLLHLGHLLPLSGQGVELQDFINVPTA